MGMGFKMIGIRDSGGDGDKTIDESYLFQKKRESAVSNKGRFVGLSPIGHNHYCDELRRHPRTRHHHPELTITIPELAITVPMPISRQHYHLSVATCG